MMLGGFTLLIFAFSVQSDSAIVSLMCVGLACFFLGLFLWWRTPRSTPSTSERFRILKSKPKAPKSQGKDDNKRNEGRNQQKK